MTAPEYMFKAKSKPSFPWHEVPLIRATDAALKGYGQLVSDPSGFDIEITRWPQQGWRPIDEGTGDEGGFVEGTFKCDWRGDVLFGENEAVKGNYVLGWSADPQKAQTDMQTTPRDQVLLWHMNYHPDGGQLFFPLDGQPFVVPAALPGDNLTPDKVVAFWGDGSAGIYIHAGVWHEGVFPVADSGRFLDRQGAVHARVSADIGTEFGVYLSCPMRADKIKNLQAIAKVCLVVIDGLRDDVARRARHSLMGAVAVGDARLWTMEACVPTISAPLYETLHTGRAPAEHGLIDNESLRPSPDPSVFSEVKASGGQCAVVGHSCFHTLFGGSTFDPFSHTEIDDPEAPIAFARYYSMNGYDADNTVQPAEIDLCAQAQLIARRYNPTYLLLHTSSCDTLGHAHTGLGDAYFRQAEKVDAALSQLIPRLIGLGYDVLVTADHGMDETGNHGGDADCLRHVPFSRSPKNYAQRTAKT